LIAKTTNIPSDGQSGAYEAGAYEATYDLLSERGVKLGRQGRPLFHITTIQIFLLTDESYPIRHISSL
jgi:hypothetical protein